LRQAGVTLRLNTEATEEAITALKPDVIVVSAGCEPIIPDISGIDGPNVMPATQVLDGDVDIGERVVIIGGGGIGTEIAPYLAKRWTLRPEIREFLKDYHALETNSEYYERRGHTVTLTSRQKSIGGTVGGSTRWVVTSEVEHAGIRVLAGTTAKRITSEGVVIEQNGREELLKADTVLVAAGLAPDTRFFEELKAKGLAPEIYSVGSPELATHAIHTVKEAYRLALAI
jgi:2,4-dienoyl-CoA reductase (NADPH2)